MEDQENKGRLPDVMSNGDVGHNTCTAIMSEIHLTSTDSSNEKRNITNESDNRSEEKQTHKRKFPIKNEEEYSETKKQKLDGSEGLPRILTDDSYLITTVSNATKSSKEEKGSIDEDAKINNECTCTTAAVIEIKENGLSGSGVMTSVDQESIGDGVKIESSVDADRSSSEEIEETPKRPEAADFPYLFRLLRDGELSSDGIRAKHCFSNESIISHVARGSKGMRTRFISTSSSEGAIDKLIRLKKRSKKYRHGCMTTIKIDVAKLPSSVQIIDLRSQTKRDEFIRCSHDEDIPLFNKYASEYDEVVLEGHIPRKCFTII